MFAMVDTGPGDHGADRLVGWKAIAGYLKVSQRTAIRWADSYGLPVSRVPRGDRPVVYANPADLEAWWQSEAAGAVRGDVPGKEEHGRHEIPRSQMGDFEAVETPDRAEGSVRHPWSVFRSVSSLKVLVLLGCALAVAWWGAVWRASVVHGGGAANASPGLVQRSDGNAASPALVEMRVTPVGQAGFTITVAEGEMARLETPNLHLGLQGKMAGRELKVFLSRLAPVGTGESVDFLESRVLPPGDAVERVRVAGTELDLMWPGDIPAAVAAARVARSQCCMVCNGVTACGRNVSAPCGGCQGELKLGGTER
jgi:hypothetical protein